MLEFDELFELLQNINIIEVKHKSINYILWISSKKYGRCIIIDAFPNRRYLINKNLEVFRLFKICGEYIYSTSTRIKLSKKYIKIWIKKIYSLVLREKLLKC